MYEYLKGTLVEITPHKACVDVGGVGYLLHIPLSTFAKLPQIGQPVHFFVSLVIREDAHRLFGFLTRQERNLFEKVQEVSGIGPKTAMTLLGHMPLEEFYTALSQGNAAAISKVPGIGKKTAERLVVELKDKSLQLLSQADTQLSLPSGHGQLSLDAISALTHLGYSFKDASQAVQKVLQQHASPPVLSQLITLALKNAK